MPRIIRGLADGYIYHVINRGNGRQEIFHKEQDYKVFIELIKEAKERYPMRLYAYCLMSNHYHIVLMPEKAEYLSKWMQWLMTSHVRRYHRHHGTSGHVWQGRYKSFIIQEDVHLLMVLRYVEGNPIRAELVNSAKEWLWSSHRERITGSPYQLINEIPVQIPNTWGSYVDELQTERELERLREGVNRQSPYGTLEWQAQVSKRLGLESTIRPRGRPSKG
ncbi:MAG: hypothetical protein DDT41_01595 [candidate division WS2 bacterium]|nr:hypothetical protein [Candidatus Psychracetigena formicireducens]